ncbi:ATP-binding protein [Stutzerimonas chloritidismutans]|uniref:ATP-binding protein n=1 Tax=Stutzerimonas chloritidismutans TaxID=203192 RepID=UPI003F17012F
MTPSNTFDLPPTCGQETFYRFGPFTLLPNQHLLLKNGARIVLGGRALDLLVALTERAGELVEKTELMARAWPRVIVEECNLRAQIVALRRVLVDDTGFNYIVTVPGRGYRFVMPEDASSSEPTTRAERSGVPALVSELVGRQTMLDTLASDLHERRLVTLTGPGGIGKSSVALALLNGEAAARFDQLHYLDASRLGEQDSLAERIAALLSPDQSLAQSAANRAAGTRSLLLLDNCDHRLDAVASTAQMLLRWVPGCHLLITSREPLNVEGEVVRRVGPLAYPDPGQPLSLEQALDHSAVRLLVERMTAHDTGFLLQETDLDPMLRICRKLEGNPLALDIVAARVHACGLRDLPQLLDRPCYLQMKGRRTADPRHGSLAALLDWSYNALQPAEQALLLQVSVFRASFTLSEVRAVVAGANEQDDLLSLIEQLVDKSLLHIRKQASARRYCMSEITRAYAQQKLEAAGEAKAASARYANHYMRLLKDAGSQLAAETGQVLETELARPGAAPRQAGERARAQPHLDVLRLSVS